MVKTFSQLNVKNMILKNRMVMPPMCMYSSDEEGIANDFHLIHYGTRAIGGVGLIILEATAIEKRGRITNTDLGLWSDKQILGLKRIVEEVKKHGAKIAVQLGHSGRKCGVEQEQSIAPSAIAFSERYQTPQEMTLEDIKEVITAFKNAAQRAKSAGFDMIEIHGAHGYLINEFLSPLSNKRTDEYGGSLENRARFLSEVLTEVRTVWDQPISLRVSAEEFQEDGNHVMDLVQVIQSIKGLIDMVNVSTGGVVLSDMEVYPGYQLSYAEIIKRETGLLTLAGGLISSGELIEESLQNNRCDLVYIGRELLRNPYFVLQAARVLHEDLEWPKQYKRSKM